MVLGSHQEEALDKHWAGQELLVVDIEDHNKLELLELLEPLEKPLVLLILLGQELVELLEHQGYLLKDH